MRSVLLSITTIFLSLSLSVNAQHQHKGVCGTATDATVDRLIKNKAAIKEGIVKNRGAVTYVPVKYILTARTNGTGRVSEEAVLDMHCHLNEVYLEQDIQFYIKDGTFKEVNNDIVYSDHRRTANTIMRASNDATAITIFMVQDIESLTGVGQTLGYYDGQRDWMVVRNDQANRTSQTLPHELGHFFSLMHPHLGWESAPFAPGEPGWPTAPNVSPGGVTTEFADGSNCENSADMVCDTPADYNGLFNNGCVHNNGAMDPKGQEIEPNTSLIMSYFGDECVNQFTPDQKAIIEADLASSERNRLEKGWTPPAVDVSPNVTIAYPTEDAVAVANGTLNVDWYDVPGATHYIFELGTNRFFNPSESFMIEGSSIELTDLTNRQYFYRIRPFSPYNTCAPKTNAFSFTIANNQATSTKEIDFVKNFSVFPNPVNRNGEVFVSVLSNESFDGEVSVVDFTGKTIYRSFENFVSGDNQIPVQLNLGANGVYLMFVKSDAGILKKKFVVNE